MELLYSVERDYLVVVKTDLFNLVVKTINLTDAANVSEVKSYHFRV